MPKQSRPTPFSWSSYLFLKSPGGLIVTVHNEYELYKLYKEGYKKANFKKLGTKLKKLRTKNSLTQNQMITLLEDSGVTLPLKAYMKLEKGTLRHHSLPLIALKGLSDIIHLPMHKII